MGNTIDKIADCVRSKDPAAMLDRVSEIVADLAPAAFSPLPKRLMYFGDDLELAKLSGTPGLPFTRAAYGGMRLGWLSESTFSKLKYFGRAVSPYGTAVTVIHGLYMAGVEVYCGVKHGALGY